MARGPRPEHDEITPQTPGLDQVELKRALRMIDLRLLTVLTFLYLLAFIDRGNIGNARIAGMNDDLNLSQTQYNIALTVFFIPYSLFEVPSNIVLKLTKPSRWIAFLVVSWGIVMTCQGVVQNFSGLVVTRTFLGFFEAGFFPASTYLLGEWYCRFEIQWRLSIFFSAASLAGAFSGLLAFALDKMDGLGNLAGWRWIFIIEGIATVVMGASVPWTLPDSPKTASFLSQNQKHLILSRLRQDSGMNAGAVETEDKLHWASLKSALLDWRVWFTIFIYWGNTIPLYGFTYTVPTIINELGYTAAEAQLLTIPIYTAGAISTLCLSRLSDRLQTRWPFIVFPYTLALCGFIGLMAVPHPDLPGLTYGLLFTVPSGVYPGVISLIAWISNNLSPSWKRAVGMAVMITLGNLGGIVGSNIYYSNEAPHYWSGYGTSVAFLCAAIAATFVLKFSYGKSNKTRDLMTEEAVRQMYTNQEILDLGDRSQLYRAGHWLPQDHSIHREFIRRASNSADAQKKRNQGRLSPAIEEFRAFIESNPRVHMYFVMMFEEIPQKDPYINDPTGTRQIRDYEHMLAVLDHIFSKAPEWTDAAEGVGLVGVPLCAIFDYPMGTPSGYAAFLDPDVNRMLKKILNEWGKFLQSSKSAEVLGDHTTGWFGPTGITSLMKVANAPLASAMSFEEMYVCDPTASYYGYKSWDDFFTRRLRPDARPVASPSDDSVIANACESRPYNVERDAKLRDRFWAKGQPYSLLDMLGHDPLVTEQFDGGTVYQAFLSALSYHRWHTPVSGKIRRAFVQEGTYFSEPLFEGVGDPSGNREEIDTRGLVLAQGYLSSLATRAIIFIEADNPAIGLMAFVGIGMDEVSTCDITVKEGQRVKKGDELGMFHFGGSSHCLVFRKGVQVAEFPEIGGDINVPVRGKLAVVQG